MKVVAIIQARMGSTRLPGKVMMKLANKTVLEHVVQRVGKSDEVDEIVIATTNKKDDDLIVREAERLGVKYYRGSEEDVLSRYYYAAKENRADIVVRITSDCPMIDSDLINNIISLFKISRCDYLSNTLKRTYPRGLDCEVFSFETLAIAFHNAMKKYQREHVTPYIYENEHIFNIQQFMDSEDHSYLRCTLDTKEDYEAISRTLEAIKEDYNYKDLVSFLNSHPEITKINMDIVQKDLRG
jgi:spore coat polysaccharide biosynthesis protein SpsF